MCIVNKKIKIAEKDTLVYKVLLYKNGSITTIFHTPDGKSRSNWDVRERNLTNDIKAMISNKATSDGYHVFPNISSALKYRKRIISEFFQFQNLATPDNKCIIVSMVIPKGTEYMIGKIMHGFYGGGITAISTPVLTL